MNDCEVFKKENSEKDIEQEFKKNQCNSFCPNCGVTLDYRKLLDDELKNKNLEFLNNLETETAIILVEYLSLFGDLNLMRSYEFNYLIKGLNEIASIEELKDSLYKTVIAIDKKRIQGYKINWFKNHNYLKKVYETELIEKRIVMNQAKMMENNFYVEDKQQNLFVSKINELNGQKDMALHNYSLSHKQISKPLQAIMELENL